MDALTTSLETSEAADPPPPTAAGATSARFRFAMAAFWTVVIMALCWMPGRLIQEIEQNSSWFEIPDLDKVIHWGIFVVFTVLWLRTSTSRWRYLWVGFAGLTFAAITELVQLIPAVGRDGEVGDAITDLIGVAIGLAIAPWIEPLLRRMESLLFRAPGVRGRPSEAGGRNH